MPSPRVLRSVVVSLFLFAGINSMSGQTFSTLVNLTPCRVMDTRSANGAFGGPFIKGASTRTVPIPNSSCQIPATAVAYSLNVTVIPRGTLYFITVWPAGQPQPNASTLNSFQGYVIANAAIVPAGAGGAISVFASGDTDLIVDINGYYKNLQMPVIPPPPPPVVIPPFPTVVSQSSTGFQSTAVGVGASSVNFANVAIGFSALAGNAAGVQNTAVGTSALSTNDSGNANAAFGFSALGTNSFGSDNTAIGANAMTNSSFGNNNSALGAHALENNGLGSDNTALGQFALQLSTASRNTAIGSNALAKTIGGSNIAVGYDAGSLLTTGSSNIYIGSLGDSANESGTVRIGTAGQQSAVYIAGIFGLPLSGGANLIINSSGQLGVAPSSRRYKEDIHDIGTTSDKLHQLRPVQFRYKKALDDGTKPIQFGLIAEEVADIYPELVIHNKDGQIEGVQYQQLPALLLNEIQKQQRTLAAQNEQIRNLTARMAALEAPVSQATSASTVQQ